MNQQPLTIWRYIFSFIPINEWYNIYNVNGRFRVAISRLMREHSQKTVNSFVDRFKWIIELNPSKLFEIATREFNINKQSIYMYFRINGIKFI